MPANWRECALGDLAQIKHGYAFKGEFFGSTGTHVVLTPGNFHEAGGFKERADKAKWYSGPVPDEYVLNAGDLIVAMTEQGEGLLGSSALVPRSGFYLHNQRLGLVTPASPTAADREFLYYLFNSRSVRQQIRASANGAKIRHTSPARIYEVKVRVPDITTQRRIASILSAYDDLIENNTRRIAILEEMARRIYEEWFVRFRFPGHENVRMVESELGPVPEGWAAVRFQELLDAWRGGDWGSEEECGADTAPVFVIRGTDFDDLAYGTGNRVPARFIELKSLEKRKLKPFDVVVENSINAKSRSAGKTLLITPGLLKRLGGDAIAASFCKVFRFHDPNLAPLAHLKMRQLFEAGDMAFFQNVAANGIANFQATRFVSTQFVALPIDELRRRQILEMFSTFTKSTYADAISNLRTTRDLLLPKLISGELDVSALPEPETVAA